MNEKNLNVKLRLSMICEVSHRYEDMMRFLEELAKEKRDDLNCDERNLISIAFKHIISYRRNALKTIANIEKKKENPDCDSLLQEYKKKLQNELVEVTIKIVSKIDSLLIPKAKDTEAKVFYWKIKGDYLRYIAENLDPIARKEYVETSFKSYNEASNFSSKLPILNPIRLGVALNLSFFYYELLHDELTACKIANETLNLAEKEIENLDEDDDTFKDTLDAIELLKENLLLWKEGKNRKTSLVK